MAKPRKTNLRAVAQANPFRPRYAKEVDSPPDRMKPETGDEALGRGSRRTSRGERGQRAGTDQPRNLGDPDQESQARGGSPEREDITARGLEPGVGEARSSEEVR